MAARIFLYDKNSIIIIKAFDKLSKCKFGVKIDGYIFQYLILI